MWTAGRRGRGGGGREIGRLPARGDGDNVAVNVEFNVVEDGYVGQGNEDVYVET